MPDVNLLQNNKEPEDRKAEKATRPDLPLSDPSAPKGIGGVFRSLFAKKPAPVQKAALPMGTGVRAAQQSTDRILSEKKTAAPMVQLPQDDDDFQVNLLNDDLVQRISPRQKAMQLSIVAVVSILVIVLANVGLGIYQGTVDKDLQTTQSKIIATTATVERLKKQTQQIDSVTNRVKAINTLLENHVYWTEFFTRLEKYTLRTVNYGAAFSGSLQGGVLLSAKTTTYEEVAKQYLLLQQAAQSRDFISSFSITSATKRSSQGQDEVDFAITMSLVPGAFSAQVQPTGGSGDNTGASDAAKRIQDINDGKCYLAATPGAAALFPTAFQQPFMAIAPTTVSTVCPALSAADLARGKTLVTTDTDADGLNDFLELIVGTSATAADTNQNGKTDLQDLLLCQNPVNATSAIPNCDPSNPLAAVS